VLKSLKQLALPIFNDDFPCVTSIPSINQTWFAVSHPPAIVRWLPQRTKPPWFGISQPRLRTPPRGPTTELCFQVPARHLLNLGADSDLVQSHLKTVGFSPEMLDLPPQSMAIFMGKRRFKPLDLGVAYFQTNPCYWNIHNHFTSENRNSSNRGTNGVLLGQANCQMQLIDFNPRQGQPQILFKHLYVGVVSSISSNWKFKSQKAASRGVPSMGKVTLR
jgi:hypothetical protein